MKLVIVNEHPQQELKPQVHDEIFQEFMRLQYNDIFTLNIIT